MADNKTDAYVGFDPTQYEVSGCGCSGDIAFDMNTGTWVAVSHEPHDPCSAAKAEAEAAKADAQQAKEALAEKTAEVEEKQAQLAEKEQQLADKQAELEQEKADHNATKQAFTETQADLDAKTAKVAELEEKLAKLEEDLKRKVVSVGGVDVAYGAVTEAEGVTSVIGEVIDGRPSLVGGPNPPSS